MFSYFLPPITNTRPARCVTLEEVYEMIASEKWAQTTRSLRSLHKEEQADFKRRQLPFITFSGIFSARHSEHIVRHSGLMCFDFDHVGDEIAVRKLQQLLVADPTLNVQLAFRSPSGDGLKVAVKCLSLTDDFLSPTDCTDDTDNPHNRFALLLRKKRSTDDTDLTPAEGLFLTEYFVAHGMHGMHGSAVAAPAGLSPTNDTNIHKCVSHTDNANKWIRWHNAQYARIASYIEQRYNVKVDKTNDVARACFLCHDPQAYCNSQLKNNLLSHTKDSLSPTNNTNIHKYENEIKIRDNSCNLWENKKNSVRENNSAGVKSVLSVEQCFRRSLKRANQKEKKESESVLSVLSVGNKHSEGVISVHSVSSVRDKNNSVEEKTIEMALRRIETHGIDVTTHYHDWYRIGMALASHYGESGRDYYHRISRFYPRYSPLETNQQYDRCLRYNNHRIGIGTLFYLLKGQ